MNAIHTQSLEGAVLETLLGPYKPHCRYVREATLEYPEDRRPPDPADPSSWIAAHGRCGVPEPCYSNKNDHFTAVEFNITYNQLLYAGLTGVVQFGLIAELQHWSLDEWWRRQWPDVLIVEYSARFHRRMHSDEFAGRFEIRQVVSKPHKRLLLLRTACQMQDESGGHSDADVLIALVNL